MMLCVVALDHGNIPLNVATDANGVNEGVVKVRGKEWRAENPATVAIAKTLRVSAVESGNGSCSEKGVRTAEEEGEEVEWKEKEEQEKEGGTRKFLSWGGMHS